MWEGKAEGKERERRGRKGVSAVADAGFLQGGCGSWCLWSAPSPFMPSLPPTLKKISWEPAAR